ncbi:MAG TPA: hypothetical protein VNU26_01035 [Mycobacteriales bacterium]|nr:hypothetical protein [Mycobacteriales bacterium]
MPLTTLRLACAAAAAATALTVLPAVAQEPVSTDPGTAATEQLYIAAGCPPATPAGGTCTSTRWLGTQPGDSTSNFLTSTTPVDEVLYRADGSLNWRDYASDTSLRKEGYLLRTAEPVVMAVAMSARGVAANMTVHARLSGTTVDRKAFDLGEQQQVVTLVADAKTLTFDFVLPPGLEGIALKTLTAEIAVHGVNAQGGYINQQGGSTVTVPFWEPAAA